MGEFTCNRVLMVHPLSCNYREVFRHKSQYQDIWIVHSNRFGNMLFLDLNESKWN